jgi:hypothetical protein
VGLLVWDIRSYSFGGEGPHQTFAFIPTMPRDTSTIEVSESEGSFAVQESTHNIHRFTHTRDNVSHPYPTALDVYIRSHRPSTIETFSDLGLSDFFIAHRRVARRRLERLDLSQSTAELLSRGSLPQLERREP